MKQKQSYICILGIRKANLIYSYVLLQRNQCHHIHDTIIKRIKLWGVMFQNCTAGYEGRHNGGLGGLQINFDRLGFFNVHTNIFAFCPHRNMCRGRTHDLRLSSAMTSMYHLHY